MSFVILWEQFWWMFYSNLVCPKYALLAFCEKRIFFRVQHGSIPDTFPDKELEIPDEKRRRHTRSRKPRWVSWKESKLSGGTPEQSRLSDINVHLHWQISNPKARFEPMAETSAKANTFLSLLVFNFLFSVLQSPLTRIWLSLKHQ